MCDLNTAIETFFPTKSVRIHSTDKPWMTSSIKLLILKRQRALHSGTNDRWRHLKNKVRKTILQRKETFYGEKAHNLKDANPLSGRMSTSLKISRADLQTRLRLVMRMKQGM